METTIVEKAWTTSKVLIKGLIIALLVFLLLIPAMYVKELILEREARQKEAITEVSSKWAGRQNITGPVLVLPYWEEHQDTSLKKDWTKHFAYFLPGELNINASVAPREKYRGIYKVILYSSAIQLSGSFVDIQPEKLQIPREKIIWNEAFVKLGLSDMKGLNEEVQLKWNDKLLVLSPDGTNSQEAGSLSALLNFTGPEDLKQVRFSSDLNLNGSEQLLFTPTGKNTRVNLSSTWPHPSFTGNMLPQTTQVKDSGFTASWKSLAHRRSFPQQWKNNEFLVNAGGEGSRANNYIGNESFGANLFVPVNGYQKTLRSVKYAVLCILLTFASFFLVDTSYKKNLHPFQYGLIGLALILFYTLLLSFSEYTGFNFSYVLASLCTIGLIAWFVKGLLGSVRLTAILSFVLVLIYTYIFTILQLQDYSLLLGSVGLFFTLGVIMHFSKKIQW